jgi:hypothetical protein
MDLIADLGYGGAILFRQSPACWIALAGIGACGPQTTVIVPGNSDAGSSDGSMDAPTADASPGPAQDCRDLADAAAKAALRCNDMCGGSPCTYAEEYQGFIQNAAGGDCNLITGIRDESTLRGTCFPSLQTISCADLKTGNLDPTCKAQLLR